MFFYVDFHIHGPYSRGTSKNLSVPLLIEGMKKKGLDIIGTGDILDGRWRKHLRATLTERDGLYSYNSKSNNLFVCTGEIEDIDGIHHLLILPDINTAEEIATKLEETLKITLNNYSGRPILKMNGEDILHLVQKKGGMIGPAHAFTPFKSLFRENRYNSLAQCYKESYKDVNFIELGLSANSMMADKIEELQHYAFLSNSDTHSLSLGKIGRECNRIHLCDMSYYAIEEAVKMHSLKNYIERNIGLDPRLGKYYSSFCYKCRRRIKYHEKLNIFNNEVLFIQENEKEFIAKISMKKARCPVCKGLIKLGVKDRIEQLASLNSLKKNRPIYINTVPLVEIIGTISGIRTLNSKKNTKGVQRATYENGNRVKCSN